MNDFISLLMNHELSVDGIIILLVLFAIGSTWKIFFYFYKKFEDMLRRKLDIEDFNKYVDFHKNEHASFLSEIEKIDQKLARMEVYQTRTSEMLHKLVGEMGGRDASIIALVQALERNVSART